MKNISKNVDWNLFKRKKIISKWHQDAAIKKSKLESHLRRRQVSPSG